jgi:type VI protein secretion system component VasF
MTDHDDDLQRVADRLRASRPQLTALELDEVSQRVRARAAARRRPRSAFMKSRLTILAMLVAGMLLCTTGAGLAVSGLSSKGNASSAAYPNEQPQGDVLGEEESGGGGGGGGGEQPAAEAPAEETQPARQVEAGAGNELPFTGYAALPVLLGGAVLLGGGLVLRARTRGDQS